MLFFFQLLIILVCTKLAGDLCVRLGQPAVLGKLIVGILIGPALLGWIQNSDLLQAFSQIGVLLLMFIAGLETDVQELNRNRNSSVTVAVGGIIMPLLGGYYGGQLMGLGQAESLFLGLLFSATSVSISVQTLKDLGQLKSRESVTILGAAIVDDILVVILLAFLMSFFVGGGDVSLGLLIGKKVLFFALIIVLGWKVVPWVMKRIAPLRVSETVITAALIVCFGFSYLAESLQIAGIIGAFAAGIAVAQTNFKTEVVHKLEPIAYAVFVPVFFVSIGVSVTFDGIMDQLPLIAGLTVMAVLTKIIGCGLGARVTGFNWKSSLSIGAGMVSRGEVALIIAAIGLEMNLLPQAFFTSVIIVVILTTLITPPLLKLLFGEQKELASNKGETMSM
ncbi:MULTISPECIES: cation:proton antiporter [unclassified Paenibacillus]|uniref:cation:proton antiporter n=1 Tax=unclassified Paenibacillus TaxID=185978 RepID=UPI001AEB888F|nr:MULTISPECIES: cation:proton antiporter [unclassified Paenibacillus]MBP1155017.1 monovalent cation:proton antiporter-2 (CPA2) family protein [Paenibacillus sp. PvP091]MBP1169600.1 monovalent cation:proton antiporter-2 (CPA2) family protein [Paenibacillus sp. PvR098]MBP2440628.1 monovalent cation:proton antiporter-2 (CPA2) family protein [Paenibacillus sp. PvP052]